MVESAVLDPNLSGDLQPVEIRVRLRNQRRLARDQIVEQEVVREYG